MKNGNLLCVTDLYIVWDGFPNTNDRLKAGSVKKVILFIVIGILLGGLATYGVVRFIAVQQIEDEIAGFVEKTPDLERIEYGKVRLGIIRPTVFMEDIQITFADSKEPILIDQIDLVVRQRGQSIPSEARVEIKGVRLNTRHELFQAVGGELNAMGYEDVTGWITLDYHYDPVKKQLAVNDVILQAGGMGRLQFEMGLTNIDLSRLGTENGQASVTSMLLILPTMGIAHGRLTYQDDSLVQRLIRLSAQRSGQDERVYWHQILARLEQGPSEEKKERVRQVISVLREFITHPKQITLTINPTNSVPLLRFLWIKKPVDLLELLNIHVSL